MVVAVIPVVIPGVVPVAYLIVHPRTAHVAVPVVHGDRTIIDEGVVVVIANCDVGSVIPARAIPARSVVPARSVGPVGSAIRAPIRSETGTLRAATALPGATRQGPWSVGQDSRSTAARAIRSQRTRSTAAGANTARDRS